MIEKSKALQTSKKLREFGITKPALQQTLIKGTSLGRKHRRKREPTKNKPQNKLRKW